MDNSQYGDSDSVDVPIEIKQEWSESPEFGENTKMFVTETEIKLSGVTNMKYDTTNYGANESYENKFESFSIPVPNYGGKIHQVKEKIGIKNEWPEDLESHKNNQIFIENIKTEPNDETSNLDNNDPLAF